MSSGSGYLAPSAIAVTAPGVKGQLEDFKLTPEGQQMIQSIQSQLQSGKDMAQIDGMKKVIKRSYDDGEMIWEISLTQNASNWYEVLIYSDGRRPSLYDLPYYFIWYNVSGYDKQSGARITYLPVPLLWPSRYIWENVGVYVPEYEANLEIVTPEELFNAPDGRGHSFIYDGQGSAYYGDSSNTWHGLFPIAPNVWYGGDGWPMFYNGSDTSLSDAGWMSQIDLVSMDTEAKTYASDNVFYFANGDQLNLNYDGKSTLQNFGDDYQYIYFIGSPQGWDINNASDEWILRKTNEGGRQYERSIYLPAGEHYFRFYGRLGDWEENSIGADPDDDTNIELDLSAGSVTAPVYVKDDEGRGKGCWIINLDNPALVKMHVDLDSKEATFTQINTNPETLYMYYMPSLNSATERVAMTTVSDGVYTGEFTRDFLANNFFVFCDAPEGENYQFTIGCSQYNYVSDNSGAYVVDGAKVATRLSLPDVTFNGFSYFLDNLGDFEKATVEVNTNNMTITIGDPNWSYDPDDFMVNIIGLDQDPLFKGNSYWFAVQTPDKQGEPIFEFTSGDANVGPHYFQELDGIAQTTCFLSSDCDDITLNVSYGDAYISGLSKEIKKTFVSENFADYSVSGLSATLDDGSKINFELNEEGWYVATMPLNYSSEFSLEMQCANGEIKGLSARVPTPVFEENYESLRGFTLQSNIWNAINFSERLTAGFKSTFKYQGDENVEAKLFFNPSTGDFMIRDASFEPILHFSQETYEVETYNDWNEVSVEVISEEIFPSSYWELTPISGNLTIENIWFDNMNNENGVYSYVIKINVFGEGEGTLTFIRVDGLGSTSARLIVRKVEPTGFSTSLDRIEIREGEFVKLMTYSEPIQGVDVDGYSFDYDIAESFDYGSEFIVIGKQPGETTLHLYVYRYNNISKDIPVTVLPKDAVIAEHIAYAYMQPGETRKHYISDHKNGTDVTPVWSSSDTSVALVDDNGNVTAIAKGRAVLTAECDNHTTFVGIHVDDSTDLDEVVSRVTVYTTGTTVVVTGAEDGDDVTVFDTDGKLAAKRIVNGTTRINLERTGAFVVTVGNETFKVML